MEKKQIVKIMEMLIMVLLMIGSFFAGFIFSNAKYGVEFNAKFEEVLGEALSKEWNCVDHDYLDYGKLLSEFPNLNKTLINNT